MDYKLLSLAYILIVITITGCQEDTQSKLTTCENTNEICIIINQCPEIIKTIENALKNRDELQKLRNLTCGFEGGTPQVCCPKESESRIVFNNSADEVATSKPRPSKPPLRDTIPQSTNNRRSNTKHTDLFPDKRVCGQVAIADRIIGGTIASIFDFPWLARIKYEYVDKLSSIELNDPYLCLASLITDRYLISVAHCFTPPDRRAVSARLGEWNTQSPGSCEEGVCLDMPVNIEIESITVHPDFDKHIGNYADIALIRLKEPVNFTDFIQPVCLPTTDYVKMQDYQRDSVYTVAGWGKTEFDTPSVIKRKVQLPSVPTDICKLALTSIRNVTSPAFICAGGKKGQDTCSGDSGGPLMRDVSENYATNWYLYGITSIGSRRCGTEGIPAVYTRVTFFMDWIRDIVKQGTT